MAALPASIPRFLLPRGSLVLRRTGNLTFSPRTTLRHASIAAGGPPPEKSQPALAKPDKYRPPSHGRQLPRSVTEQRSYGPELTEEEREAMDKKWYPNSMPPPGTWKHWFMHAKWLHVLICLSVLGPLSAGAWWMEFYHKTPFKHLVPRKEEWLEAPVQTLYRFLEVYKMDINHKTDASVEWSLRKEADAEKRKMYRAAKKRAAEERGEHWVDDPRYIIGEDGKRRRRVKKWFGIWE